MSTGVEIGSANVDVVAPSSDGQTLAVGMRRVR
jgi:hypothetical protein